MSDIVATVTSPVTAPLGWAKAKPFAFVFFVLAVFLLAIRFRNQIASGLSKIPVVGKWLTGVAAAGAFLIAAGYALLQAPRPVVVAHPTVALVETVYTAGFSHGHRVQAYSADGADVVLALPSAFSGKGRAS